MDRRSFVASGLAGGVLAAIQTAGPQLVVPQSLVARNRGAGGWVGRDPDTLNDRTIPELQAAMQSGQVSSRALVEHYLARIDAFDRQGPALRAVLECNPDALQIADTLDAERRAGHVRGRLHGIPVLLKDNIVTADRMQATAGSLALVGATAPRDAFIVTRLRAAGAIILGKANLSEWANFRSIHSSSGWSARGGQARNPYVLDRTPLGSSSGSAVAVAANLCAVAIGTETDGSIVSPSGACSVVGIKPTIGLLSRAGLVPISHTQDSPGPMARSVVDVAILLGVMTGVDDRDAATTSSQGHAETDYTRVLDPGGLRGARIGVARKHFFGYSELADRVIEDSLDVMRREGAIVVDPANLETAGRYDDDEMTVLVYDFKTDLNRYLAELGPDAPIHSMADAIAFNLAHREAEMPFWGQELMVQAQAKGPLSDPVYQKALARCRRLSRTEGIDRTMDRYRLDAIVAPTQGPPWVIDLVNGDPPGAMSSSTPAAVAGYPNITVPAGYTYGLPIGLSIMGRAYSEPMLLRIAYAFEHATNARQAPRFFQTADLAASSAAPPAGPPR